MNPIFKKLQFKQTDKIYILNAPKEFKSNLEEMAEITTIKKSPKCKQKYDFVVYFVKSCEDIQKYAQKAADKLNDDAILWFAYPKKSSRKYQSDISRDNGWKPLGSLGFEGVRQIAIDDDWSALRFKQADKIKTMTRNAEMALSTVGKQRGRKS
jgi:hypothetical protein